MEGALPRQRKAYKITKQREKWSDDEHARFVEAIDRFGRDWAKIVAHIGTRTVAQVRSHAQKFFLKLEKAGKADVVPPPRPKKRAAKPYPVQSERSEERRKSKRFRGSSSVTSTLSDTQDGTAGPSLTPTASGARASPRSYQTTFPSSRPVRAARLTRAAMAKEMSSGDLEGDGSNIASTHESNNESSGGPSAADNSGLSKPELMPTKGNMQPAGTSAPDYTKLFTVVGNVFNSGGSDNEANHQQMVQQLEPSQRQASHPQQSTASSLITVTPDSHDAYDDTSNALQPRATLVAMMKKLTGDLRNTQQNQLPQQELQADIRQGGQPAMPGTPSLHAPNACLSLPAARTSSPLDHAPSMALIPSSSSLAVPASLTDETLPVLHPLPGAQGTALLQLLPTPYGAAEVQGKAYDEPELLQNSDSLQNSSTITVADMPQLITAAQSPRKSVELLPEMEDAADQSIADQLLVNSPNPSSMDDDLSLDVAPSHSGAALDPKSAEALMMGSTPLDDCLAQLTSETAPSLRIPGSDDFMDSWKISGNDPVWQSLDLKGSPVGASPPSRPEDDAIFSF